ncbi:hypothetical protein [Hoeflea sp.]|uniref:hypothetical protein n=1 Tax=Hoeflea sp. TaxID=1940281 RepID=UPI0019AEA69C|nr:hypothetical protein [Hoeflea sp.]MBC7283569.1 hypothetical protein [Hoeflea sp.]
MQKASIAAFVGFDFSAIAISTPRNGRIIMLFVNGQGQFVTLRRHSLPFCTAKMRPSRQTGLALAAEAALIPHPGIGIARHKPVYFHPNQPVNKPDRYTRAKMPHQQQVTPVASDVILWFEAPDI